MTAINPYEPPQHVSQPAAPGALPVRVTGTLTADDAISALRALGKWRPWLLPAITVPIMVVVSMAMHVVAGVDTWTVVLAPLIAIALLLWFSLGSRRGIEKQWNAVADNVQAIAWTFSDEGLLIEAATTKQLLSWSAFTRATITPDKLILTQQGEGTWNFIPRRLFATDGDWLAVTQLVAAKLPVRQIGR